MLTKEQAIKAGEYSGTVLHHATAKGGDGTPARCRSNGKCKTWKTRPDDFQLPVKYGIKMCFYITPANADSWNLPE